ncbi:hypothetical protein B0H65DRAFT_567155 [Neurospora tetraspora]|uniref:Uncharacterized protein n=1 Tax=Neurospora tetraspora TaxID=94610 RepID=A0AAE0JKB3_9PEZI|nr:hypothetical protein B0H65DRAFT_567155 [Neurospora tetraspora]
MSRRLSHIIPALLLLLLVYWLCLWVKMDKSLRLTGTPVRVNIGGGVAGDAAGNGTNCITAAAATTEPVTTADVPAEITGAAAAAVAVAAAAEKPDKAEKTGKAEEKTEEVGDKKKQKKEKKEKEEAAEEKAAAKDVVAWWKQMAVKPLQWVISVIAFPLYKRSGSRSDTSPGRRSLRLPTGALVPNLKSTSISKMEEATTNMRGGARFNDPVIMKPPPETPTTGNRAQRDELPEDFFDFDFDFAAEDMIPRMAQPNTTNSQELRKVLGHTELPQGFRGWLSRNPMLVLCWFLTFTVGIPLRYAVHHDACLATKTTLSHLLLASSAFDNNNLASSLARIFSSSRALTLARWLRYAAPSWGKNGDLSTPMYEDVARTWTYFNHACSGALIQKNNSTVSRYPDQKPSAQNPLCRAICTRLLRRLRRYFVKWKFTIRG